MNDATTASTDCTYAETSRTNTRGREVCISTNTFRRKS